jgi:Ca2+-binding EF-hand superfamily protein
MGQTNTKEIPFRDVRIDRMIEKFRLSEYNLRSLYSVYSKYDVENLNSISTEIYFTKILKISRSHIGEYIFDIIDRSKPGYLTFGEFVELSCTFSGFEVADLIKFCFYIMDRDQTGKVYKVCYNNLVPLHHLIDIFFRMIFAIL